MDSLITYPNGTDQPGVTIPTINGFVSRVVSAVACENIPDAERVAKILNAHFAEKQESKPIEHLCEICEERIGKQNEEALYWLGNKAEFICNECAIDQAERNMAGAA
jgi:uncharacterized protein YlaI